MTFRHDDDRRPVESVMVGRFGDLAAIGDIVRTTIGSLRVTVVGTITAIHRNRFTGDDEVEVVIDKQAQDDGLFVAGHLRGARIGVAADKVELDL